MKVRAQQQELLFSQPASVAPPAVEEELTTLLAQLILAIHPTTIEETINDQDQ